VVVMEHIEDRLIIYIILDEVMYIRRQAADAVDRKPSSLYNITSPVDFYQSPCKRTWAAG
jgi:hypothetical protein